MKLVGDMLDIGAGPTEIDTPFVLPTCDNLLKPVRDPKLKGTRSKTLNFLGVIISHVCVETSESTHYLVLEIILM